MKKQSRNSISEALAQVMGSGAISDGKPDYDATGRGSMTPSPVVTGMPIATPVPSPVVPNSVAGMVAKPAPTAVAPKKEKEETEEEETEEEEEPTEVEEQARAEFRNALVSLLGEENASEELVVQLEGIFEAAVNDRVQKTVAEITEGVDSNVKTYLDNVTEALVEKVDDYLDYVVEEWMQENAVAVEQGVKTQIAENFINGLKNLFENHYIDVPNEKYNVLDELYSQNRELQNKLNEAVKTNISLSKEISLTECAGIFVAETRDLADTQIAKLQSLMESVSYGTPEEYREKLVAIKENYLNNSRVSHKVVDVQETFATAKPTPTSLVENYVGAIGRLNKKV